MSGSDITVVISSVTLATVIVGWSHVSGKLVQRLKAVELKTEKLECDHTKRLDNHDEHLAKIDVALVKLEYYQKGFEIAASLTGGRRVKRGVDHAEGIRD